MSRAGIILIYMSMFSKSSSIALIFPLLFLFGCAGEDGKRTEFSHKGYSGSLGLPNLSFKPGKEFVDAGFVVPPYIQPGNASSLAKERRVIIWQTKDVPQYFTVEYGMGDGKRSVAYPKVSTVVSDGKKYRLYTAELSPLRLDTEYGYTVVMNHHACARGNFRTRTKGESFRCVVLGDSGQGTHSQLKIAQQISLQKPDFLLHLGDFAYGQGLISDTLQHAFPYYNPVEDPTIKAPSLMRDIPFYLTFGNHDVCYSRDLNKKPDGLAAFYYFNLPLNGPLATRKPEVTGNPKAVSDFKNTVGSKFPRMTNYSFDWGNAHFVILDGNSYTHPLDNARLAWLKNDLANSKAQWKLVSVHQPPFCSRDRYKQQGMRLLAKTFEDLGVDMVFSGHIHNYQRSKPLRFTPDSVNHPGIVHAVKGKFVLDQNFDGKGVTKPNGVIYVLSGAGGGSLYDKEFTHRSASWEPFTANYIADYHSFTVLDISGKTLSLKQINDTGQLLDQITVAK